MEQSRQDVIFTLDPWACGHAAISLLMEAHNVGCLVIDEAPYVSRIIQLYSRIRSTLSFEVDDWTDMELIIATLEERDLTTNLTFREHIFIPVSGIFTIIALDSVVAAAPPMGSTDSFRALETFRRQVKKDITESHLCVDLLSLEQKSALILEKLAKLFKVILRNDFDFDYPFGSTSPESPISP